ncbi:MAG: AzlD domain-containing protein [Ilumatobacter sp.]|nr:AzlD domain-containing protein [Ilumatobacter sp.]
MSVWSALALTLVVGAITYGMRAIAIVGLAGREIPQPIQRALRNVGPAVLAALALNLAAGGEGSVGLTWPEGLALVAAGITAWFSRNVIATLVAGMSVLWIAEALL